MLLRAAAVLLVVVLLVLVVMNLLVVSNLGDKVQALQAEVERLKTTSSPAAAVSADLPFETETPPFTTNEDGTVAPQTVTLGGVSTARKVTVALTEVVGVDDVSTPVHASPVLVFPGVATEMPLGRDAACVPLPGASPSWSLTVTGATLKIAPKGCFYQKPTRARLRGLVTP
jgi:hypothetical protein